MKTNCNRHHAIVFPLIFVFTAAGAQFSATSSLPGSVAVTPATQGFDWNNPANIKAADGNFATCLISGANKPTDYLDAKGWGFQSADNTLPNYVPPAGFINGIEVYITLRKTDGGSIKDNKVILLKAGAESGTSKSRGNTLWPANASEVKFGNSTDLWGTSWTPADLVNNGFGIRISAKTRGSKTAQAEIDHIRIVLYFDQSYFYSKSSGNLEQLTTWGTNTDGSGLNPSDFTAGGQIFFLYNRTVASLTGDLTISGNNSKLVIGNGTSATALTVPASYALQSLVDISSSSSLTVTNTITPALGNISDNTNVTFNASANQTVPAAQYYNLTLAGSSTKTLENATGGASYVNNVLTISAGVVFDNNGDDVNVYGSTTGISNNGTATGSGKFIYSLVDVNTNISGSGTYSNFEADFSSSTSSAKTLTISNATTVTGLLYLSNGILANGSNLTMAPSSTIVVADGSLAGAITASAGYNVVMVAYTTTSPKTTANEISGTVRNFTLQTGNGNAVNLSKNLVLTGNLTLLSGILDPTASNYTISVGGDFTNQATLVYRNTTLTFDGSSAQNLLAASAQSFYNLVINNFSGGLTLYAPATANHQLTLTGGIVYTNSANPITVSAGATVSGGSTTAYISGPFKASVAALSGNLFFPVGKDDAYRPVNLAVTQVTSAATTYSAEVFSGAPPSRNLPASLLNVSAVRYYTVTPDNGANVNTATISLVYNADDNVTDNTLLRIAKSSSGDWLDIGGSGSDPASGTIASNAFSGFSDFVLANAVSSVLALNWVSFTGRAENGTVVLNWRTAEESEASYFQVERSTDAAHWAIAGIVNCRNGMLNDYRFTDYLVAGRLLYRLKLVNANGSVSYSRAIEIKGETKGGIRVISAAPGSSSLTCIVTDTQLLTAPVASITVVDVYGRTLMHESKPVQNTLKLQLPPLSSGKYILVVEANGIAEKAVFSVH